MKNAMKRIADENNVNLQSPMPSTPLKSTLPTPNSLALNGNFSTPSKASTTPAKKNPLFQANAEPMQTFARIRPQVGDESQKELASIVRVVDDSTVALQIPQELSERHYSFTKVMGPQTSQSDVFVTTTLPLLENFLTGSNGTQAFLFTYGVTGSGKTFTITGTPENPGILPRSVAFIFQKIDQVVKVAQLKLLFYFIC